MACRRRANATLRVGRSSTIPRAAGAELGGIPASVGTDRPASTTLRTPPIPPVRCGRSQRRRDAVGRGARTAAVRRTLIALWLVVVAALPVHAFAGGSTFVQVATGDGRVWASTGFDTLAVDPITSVAGPPRLATTGPDQLYPDGTVVAAGQLWT